MNNEDMKKLYKDFREYIERMDKHDFLNDIRIATEHSYNSYILEKTYNRFNKKAGLA